MAAPFHAGRLLVALPMLDDPNFDRTVVLLLEHGPEGALGVVLNRPTDVSLARELPEWEPLAGGHGVFFVGGPVAPGTAIALGRVDPAEVPDGEGDGWRPVLGPLGTVDLGRHPTSIRPEPRQVRVFAGYSGWSAGQLEGEVDDGAWLVLDAEPADALTADPEGLWHAVLRRQPGRTGWLGNFPPDPSVN
ncbi:MAG: YqgE/AlgH family protein [Acidimicrobiales bacterium]|nr:YqgE/AlgH family protein [Acidimicrobiales bacterium]